jgi:hypothetical protein
MCSVNAADKKREREVHKFCLVAIHKDLFWEILPLEILMNTTWQYPATMHMKVKVKLTLEQAMKAQRGSRVLLFL